MAELKTKIKIESNLDEETEKAKELVSLLEKANKLIQSLNSISIDVEKED